MASAKAQEEPEFIPSGFLVLRTPLLPFDELLAWSDGLEASASPTDSTWLEQALAADRAKLHQRLGRIMLRPEMREALFVASPHLEESIGIWLRDPESDRGKGLERAMARYFLRMAGRATPFGLCAGCSVGTIGDATRLLVDAKSRWKGNTRLDMDYLSALTDALAADPKFRDVFLYRPNSSLYRAAGRLRYAESRIEQKEQERLRSYQLIAVDETAALKAVLDHAHDGASFAQLAATIVDQEISLEDARDYVAKLIENQILVPDIHLSVTGTEAIERLIAQFAAHPKTAAIADVLAKVRDQLAEVDKTGLGNAPEAYRRTAKLLADLPAKVELSRLVQVELIKPAPELALGRSVLAELSRGVKLLHRIARLPRSELDELTRFREAFVARYEQRLVPLNEALDGEIGIGFPMVDNIHDRESPLLKDLAFPSQRVGTARWDEREKLLLRKIVNALVEDCREITLDKDDIERMSAPDPPPLPDSFGLVATVEASSEAALAAGAFRVLLSAIHGPSGAVLLGRFCRTNPILREHVERHLRAEEALHPKAVFAEIVHLPEGRIGNILARPVLRAYEISYLGHPGIAADRQIPVTDLYIRSEGDRLKLYSARLSREVIPRLTSAHNFDWRGVPIYRFLASLQYQNVPSLNWSWGALENAPFLPRLTSGKLVLSRACWRADKKELRALGQERGAAQFRAFQIWRASRRLPRLVALADGDNELPLDLDNVLCVETLIDQVKGRNAATLVELFPGPDALCARGPEGRYVHEMIVPFVRTKREEPTPEEARKPSPPFTIHDSPTAIARRFPPGSEWLYVKLYTGTATADRILCETVTPLVRQLLKSGAADNWFFMRYGDPDPHVRLRFHGNRQILHKRAMPTVESAFTPLLADNRLWRVQYDTYEREIERYGGAKAMLLGEKLFQIDSESALEILDQLEPGDAGAEERWRLALRGIDALLDDLGFDLAVKTEILKKVRTEFAREFKIDSQVKGQLSDRFRKARKSLEKLLNRAGHEDDPLAPGLEILQRRSTRLRPIVAKLKALEKDDQLTIPLTEIAPSYVHMFVNRMLRSAQRANEVVLYDFLARLYQSRLARDKP
jgi:thiopeptide-type bacteriocin biosynthesis protein